MLHLIEATRFHLNGELTEHDLWLKQKFERVYLHSSGKETQLSTVRFFWDWVYLYGKHPKPKIPQSLWLALTSDLPHIFLFLVCDYSGKSESRVAPEPPPLPKSHLNPNAIYWIWDILYNLVLSIQLSFAHRMRSNFQGSSRLILSQSKRDNLASCSLFQAWGEKVLQKEDKFRDMQKYKLELDRKIGQKVDDDIVTSVTGTFRKLNVD